MDDDEQLEDDITSVELGTDKKINRLKEVNDVKRKGKKTSQGRN